VSKISPDDCTDFNMETPIAWTLVAIGRCCVFEHNGTGMFDALLERDTSRKYSLWWIQQTKCQPTV
jgi:hypothetical protein